MTSDILYDSPTELMHELARGEGRCDAQSVIPDGSGDYICACSCGDWEVRAPGRLEGLRLARQHTGSE